MNENTRNMLLAAAVSMIFIGLWDYFYAFPEMDRQKKVLAEQERLAKVTPLGAPEKPVAETVKRILQTRETALAQSPRVTIDSKSISGSVALKGARIDDVSLKNYRQAVDPASPIITLLSPENGPDAYYAELG